MAPPIKPEPPKTEVPTPAKTNAAPAAAELTFDEKVALAVTKNLGTLMPTMAAEMAKAFGTAMIAADMAKNQTAHDINTRAVKAKLAKEEKCQCCRQVVGDGKRNGCGGPWRRDAKTNQFVMEPVLNPDGSPATDGDGKPITRRIEDYGQFHTKRVVWPADPIAAEWFDGVTINGARYKSAGPGHQIWVPKNGDVDTALSAYTQNEVEQRIGRRHVRANGGRISGGAGGANVAPTGVGFN